MRYLKLIMLLSVCFILLLAACSQEKEDGEKEETEEVIELEGEPMKPEEFSEAFLAGDYKKVYAQLSKDFQREVSLQQLEALGKDFNQGIEAYILQSELPYGEAKQYTWTDDTGTKGMVAVFDPDNMVLGLQIMPLNTFPETDEIFTETVFDVPFQEAWFVFWGGTNRLINYHYDYENQRYAYDFVMMKEGITYDGDAALNESYYAFGQAYLAPADGTVVKVENEIKDNEPVGQMNEEQPLGNYVIIDHGKDEYSYLAHFKYQSIEVKEGDKVKQGDVLGQVGNSGNSSEPHIHFHVADSPDPAASKSIRIQFDREDEFIQGETVK